MKKIINKNKDAMYHTRWAGFGSVSRARHLNVYYRRMEEMEESRKELRRTRKRKGIRREKELKITSKYVNRRRMEKIEELRK